MLELVPVDKTQLWRVKCFSSGNSRYHICSRLHSLAVQEEGDLVNETIESYPFQYRRRLQVI